MSYAPGIALSVSLTLVACVGQVGGEPNDPPAADAASSPDAATTPAADGSVPGADARDTADASPGLLASQPGCFFTVANPSSTWQTQVGERALQYSRLQIDYDVIHGGWRTELFDRSVLNHNLMGLTRNVGDFVGRYILGNAARIQPNTAGLTRQSLFYGRVDLEPRPAGEGYMGYTAWRKSFAWVPGNTYHVRVVLDAVDKTQRLIVSDETTQAGILGEIAYWEPSLSEATFTLQLGSEDSDGREVNAVGWQFCDLRVRGNAL